MPTFLLSLMKILPIDLLAQPLGVDNWFPKFIKLEDDAVVF